MRPSGLRAGFGGANSTLGHHPIAEELRSIGSLRPALMSSEVSRLAMAFEAAIAS
ncbi:hypothetical protein [Nocardia amamiensis]|uniref:hypothetical protein n=1 Tax=Nocardia amamiensis TaxID=404578 RepID=UPI000ACF9CA8|nr:hypothetical protein [Nocardia amamiensis]